MTRPWLGEEGVQNRVKCPFGFRAPRTLSQRSCKDRLTVPFIRMEEAFCLRAGDPGRQLMALQGAGDLRPGSFSDYLERHNY